MREKHGEGTVPRKTLQVYHCLATPPNAGYESACTAAAKDTCLIRRKIGRKVRGEIGELFQGRKKEVGDRESGGGEGLLEFDVSR